MCVTKQLLKHLPYGVGQKLGHNIGITSHYNNNLGLFAMQYGVIVVPANSQIRHKIHCLVRLSIHYFLSLNKSVVT